MKLYLAPGACSLADHIALHEAGIEFERVTVDLKATTFEGGGDYSQINPKGYVPALQFDDGAVLTENIAILSWIAERSDLGGPGGALSRARLLEALAFISTEIHKAFKPFLSPAAGEADKAAAKQTIEKRLGYLADRWKGDYLFDDKVSVASLDRLGARPTHIMSSICTVGRRNVAWNGLCGRKIGVHEADSAN